MVHAAVRSGITASVANPEKRSTMRRSCAVSPPTVIFLKSSPTTCRGIVYEDDAYRLWLRTRRTFPIAHRSQTSTHCLQSAFNVGQK